MSNIDKKNLICYNSLMVNKQIIRKEKPSELSKFNLYFEYDKTDAKVRQEVRHRTDKSLA